MSDRVNEYPFIHVRPKKKLLSGLHIYFSEPIPNEINTIFYEVLDYLFPLSKRKNSFLEFDLNLLLSSPLLRKKYLDSSIDPWRAQLIWTHLFPSTVLQLGRSFSDLAPNLLLLIASQKRLTLTEKQEKEIERVWSIGPQEASLVPLSYQPIGRQFEKGEFIQIYAYYFPMIYSSPSQSSPSWNKVGSDREQIFHRLLLTPDSEIINHPPSLLPRSRPEILADRLEEILEVNFRLYPGLSCLNPAYQTLESFPDRPTLAFGSALQGYTCFEMKEYLIWLNHQSQVFPPYKNDKPLTSNQIRSLLSLLENQSEYEAFEPYLLRQEKRWFRLSEIPDRMEVKKLLKNILWLALKILRWSPSLFLEEGKEPDPFEKDLPLSREDQRRAPSQAFREELLAFQIMGPEDKTYTAVEEHHFLTLIIQKYLLLILEDENHLLLTDLDKLLKEIWEGEICLRSTVHTLLEIVLTGQKVFSFQLLNPEAGNQILSVLTLASPEGVEACQI